MLFGWFVRMPLAAQLIVGPAALAASSGIGFLIGEGQRAFVAWLIKEDPDPDDWSKILGLPVVEGFPAGMGRLGVPLVVAAEAEAVPAQQQQL